MKKTHIGGENMIDERWHPPVEAIVGLNPQSEAELKKLFSIGAALMAWGVSGYRTERGREWMLTAGGCIEYPVHDFVVLRHEETLVALDQPVHMLEKSSLADFTLTASDCDEIIDYLNRIGGLEPGADPIKSADVDILTVMTSLERWMVMNRLHYRNVMTDVALLHDTKWPNIVVVFDQRRSMITTDKLEASVCMAKVDYCEGCGFNMPCVANGLCFNCLAQMSGDIASFECTHYECHMINCEHCWNEEEEMFNEAYEDEDLYQREWRP
jgi:hypothetical protein